MSWIFLIQYSALLVASRNSTCRPLIYIHRRVQMSWAGENVHVVGCLTFTRHVQIEDLTPRVLMSNGSFWNMSADLGSGRTGERHETSCIHSKKVEYFCACRCGWWGQESWWTLARRLLELWWSQSPPWSSLKTLPQQLWECQRTQPVPQTHLPSWWGCGRSPGSPHAHIVGLNWSGCACVRLGRIGSAELGKGW